MDASSVDTYFVKTKRIRTLLKEFDSGEKRKWPTYLNELSKCFDQFYFGKNQTDSTTKLFEECKRVFARVLTTKLFSDIIKEIITCLTSFSASLEFNCNHLFNWMFTVYHSSNSSDSKIVILNSIAKIIEVNHKGLNDNLSNLLNKTKRAFEDTESSELLIAFTEIFLAAAKTNPKIMISHFQNVVDIIISWHLNSSTHNSYSNSSSSNLSRALIGFKQFWINDINFSTSLLNQFVDDFQNLYEELKDGHQSLTTNQYCKKFEMMTSLIKIYIAVLKSLIQSFKPDHNQLVDRLRKFMRNVKHLIELYDDANENLVISVNDCALYTLNTLNAEQQQNLNQELATDLINYLTFIQDLEFNQNDLFNISTIKLTIKLVTLNKNLPIAFISKLLHSKSNFQRLRFLPSKQILISYNELIHTLLSLKSITILEETYKCILIDLQINLTSLLNTKIVLLNDQNYDDDEQQDQEQQKNDKNIGLAIISNLISLTYFCQSKQSMIAIWGLKPTFFDLLTCSLQPTNDSLTKKYSNIQYLIIYILYVYCSNHQNYLSISSLLTTSSSFKCSYAESNLTNGYLVRILKIIIDLLRKDCLNKKSLLLCLNWFKEIVQSSRDYLNLLCKNDLFYELIDLIIVYAYYKQSDICIKCCEIIELIISNSSTNQKLRSENQNKQNLKNSSIKSFYEICLFHLTNSNLEIKNAFLKLLSNLPLKSIMINENLRSEKLFKTNDFYFNQDLKSIKKQIMKQEPSNLFSSISFRILMSSFTNNNNLNDDDLEWLKRVLHLNYNFDIDFDSLSSSKNQDQSLTFSNLIDLNSETLYFWFCWELTQFCILNKLRTPLGKAQDTFTKIENMIRQNAACYLIQDANNQLNSSSSSSSQSNQSNQKQFQVKLLLQLMENLEKLLYNAYNGGSLFKTSNAAKTFFTTNKNTCIEWINRNRIYLMMIALRSDDHGIVWRNGELLLSNSNFLNKSMPIENVLVILTQALINLNECNYIVGLHKWCLKKFENLNLDWMNGAIEESKGSYEKALLAYIELLDSNFSLDKKDEQLTKQVVYQFLIRRILECYLNLGKNQELIEFYTKHNVKELNGLFSFNFDLQYISWFEDVFDLKSNLSWKSFSYDRADNLLNWDSTQTQHQIEKKLIFAANSLLIEGENLQTLDIIKDVYQLASSSLSFSTQCGPNKLNMKFVILQKIAQSIKQLFDKSSPHQSSTQSSNLDQDVVNLEDIKNLNFDCSTLIFCIKWLNVLEGLRCKTKLVDNPVLPFDKLHFLTAKSARKQGNLEIAYKYLLNYATTVCEYKNNFDELNLKKLLTNKLNKDFKNDFLNLQYEAAKLFHCLDDTKSSVELIFDFISKSYSSLDNLTTEGKELWSRSVLKLVKYAQIDQNNLSQVFIENANNLCKLLQNVNEPYIINSSALKQNDLLVGKLIHLSTIGCPSLGKTWVKLGHWSYRWARKLIDENEKKSENDKLFEYGENLYGFYKLAAKSYFKFLSLRENDLEDTNVTATLRLLKLIVRHSPILKEILEDGLKSTPIDPWKTIILQLFARLGHPQPYVRQIISDLLCRIAKESPHLIIFPVASSVLNENNKFKLDEKFIELNTSYSAENDDEDFDDKEIKFSTLTNDEQKMYNDSVSNCHKTLLATQNPILVQQTTIFIEELKRIILLWNELWIGTLINLLSEMKKQVNVMEHEVNKIKKNTELSKEQKDNLLIERHNLVFKKIIFNLEQTQTITNQQVRTPHEDWFQKTFSSLISNVIKSLRNPEQADNPSSTLDIYYNLIFTLQKKTPQMNVGRSQFAMSTISPILNTMENTIIPMPGANSYNQTNIVSIEKVYKTVVTLHTKTKPKKLGFYGSNGKLYTFLFKGEEDLHLDERIMQMHSVINRMFNKSFNNQTYKVLYKARFYSVTPIGSFSGLIQWVDGTALYSIYRRWLMSKEQKIDSQTKESKTVLDRNHRPSEKFNQKLIEKHLTNKNRSSWPLEKLIEIHKELVEETPCDLISKELWCSSTNAFEYWKITQNFIHTNAGK